MHLRYLSFSLFLLPAPVDCADYPYPGPLQLFHYPINRMHIKFVLVRSTTDMYVSSSCNLNQSTFWMCCMDLLTEDISICNVFKHRTFRDNASYLNQEIRSKVISQNSSYSYCILHS